MRSTLAFTAFAIAVTAVACGTDRRRSDFGTEPPTEDGGSVPGFNGDSGPSCLGLECKVVACEKGATTKLRGKVFDPAGKHPLYNVMVYVPSGSDPENLPPMKDSTVEPDGIQCETCASVVVNPLSSALTDGTGSFELENVPVGKEIPVVIQVGKWRRLLHVDVTEPCDANDVEDGVLTLPKNGSEGDMPQIAVTTGDVDSLECLLRGIGIDEDEFVVGHATGGHVHLFKGEGGGMGAPAETFWTDAAALRKYDMVLLSCEGSTYKNNKGGDLDGPRASMYEYLNAGGKVFATHFHYVWFQSSPEADFRNLATWKTPAATATSYAINETFPKGQKLAEWLVEVGASKTPGEIELENLAISATAVNDNAVTWISSSKGEPVYFSVNTPISNPDGSPAAPESQCGRAVLTGLHVADDGGETSLSACTIDPGKLSAQQAALEFLFFDLSACVTDDRVAPQPPK